MSRAFRLTLAAAATGIVALAGCAPGADAGRAAPGGHEQHGVGTNPPAMDHPMDGGPVPAGMTAAADPAYPIGSIVTLTADHMAGMRGATATVVGAYDTYTYAVDYTPTTGGTPLTDHKWVVQEELEDAGDERLPDGEQVTMLAEHMPGMNGASANIASSTDETVYVVDYQMGGMTMTNHKWVVESELEPN